MCARQIGLRSASSLPCASRQNRGVAEPVRNFRVASCDDLHAEHKSRSQSGCTIHLSLAIFQRCRTDGEAERQRRGIIFRHLSLLSTVVLSRRPCAIEKLPFVRSTSTNAASHRIRSHMNDNKRLKMDTVSGPGIVTHS